ncbi:MAG: CU044_2847 family protein [Deltaproteobacteria bacterium]
MGRVIKVGEFLVEVEEGVAELPGDDSSGTERTDATDKIIDAVEELRGSIASTCDVVLGAFTKANRPDELKVKFGLKFAGEVGIPIVTKGTAEAAIEIEALWKNEPSKGPAAGDPGDEEA